MLGNNDARLPSNEIITLILEIIMNKIIAFLLFILMSNTAIAANSAQCTELIDKMEDIAELKKALHCQSKVIDAAKNVPKQQAQTTQQPRDQTRTQSTSPAPPHQPVVKKSKSNICHGKGTRYYNQTRRYTEFKTMLACLDSGGRLPRG